MKLFVDDIRPFPKSEDYICCKSYDEAVNLMLKHEFEYVTLDYDLGYSETGYDILVWMNNNNIRPKSINIHSSHPYGRMQMKDYCHANFPDSKLTLESYADLFLR